MARLPAIFLAVLLCGLLLLLSLQIPVPDPGRNKVPRRSRTRTLVAHEGDSDDPSFFCDVRRSDCPPVPSKSKTGWHGGLPGLPDLYLYSAHYDLRVRLRSATRHYVRIFGVVREEEFDRLRIFCQLWYAELPRPIVVEAVRTEIWDSRWDGGKPSRSRYYRPFLFSCPVPGNTSGSFPRGPANATLSLEPCACPSHSLPLRRSPEKRRGGFAVCVKGLDFPQDVSLRLVEWIETQFLLGADSIFFYVFDVHPKIDLVLRFYRRFRNVDFVKLKLPGRDEPNSPVKRRNYLSANRWQKRRHELIPYNDCYYRHVATHDFVLPVDVDEVVVPTGHADWHDLLSSVARDRPTLLSKYASLAVPNVFFFSRFGTEHLNRPDEARLRLLTHVTRSANFTRPGFAVKSFFTTNGSLVVFNHYSLVPLRSGLGRTALLGADLARLHHYKDACPPEMEDECEANFFKYTVEDRTLWRYKDKLLRNIDEVRSGLKKMFLVMI